LFENLSENSLKGDLSNAATVNPPLFSFVNTFNAKFVTHSSTVSYCFKTNCRETNRAMVEEIGVVCVTHTDYKNNKLAFACNYKQHFPRNPSEIDNIWNHFVWFILFKIQLSVSICFLFSIPQKEYQPPVR